MRLNRLIESMPAELRKRYEETPRRSSVLQERLKVSCAMHLWKKGFKNIEFKKDLQLGGGKLAYVDVFENRQKIAVECETRIDKSKMGKRSKTLRKALPTARLVLTLPNRIIFSRKMALKARRVAGLVNEVWLVGKDGSVTDLNTGIGRYRQRIEGLLERHRSRSRKLLEEYRLVKEARDWLVERRGVLPTGAKSALRKAAEALVGEGAASELVKVDVIDPSMENSIERAEDYMESIRAEVLRSVVEVANEVLSVNSDLVLRIEEDERGVRCLVQMDEDKSEWLGLSDRPAT